MTHRKHSISKKLPFWSPSNNLSKGREENFPSGLMCQVFVWVIKKLLDVTRTIFPKFPSDGQKKVLILWRWLFTLKSYDYLWCIGLLELNINFVDDTDILKGCNDRKKRDFFTNKNWNNEGPNQNNSQAYFVSYFTLGVRRKLVFVLGY